MALVITLKVVIWQDGKNEWKIDDKWTDIKATSINLSDSNLGHKAALFKEVKEAQPMRKVADPSKKIQSDRL